MRRLIAIALALALTGCPVAIPAGAGPVPIEISDSDGGNLWTFASFYEAIRASGAPVRINGVCISACTLVLMMPMSQVCVTERSTLGFHAVTTNGRADVGMTHAVQRRYFPKVLWEFLDAHWEQEPEGIPTVGNVFYVSAQALVNMGAARMCDDTVAEIQ